MTSIVPITPIPPQVINQTKSQAIKRKKTQAHPPITYTAKEFAELFRAQNEVKFPANTRIKILHIDPILGLKVLLAEAGNAKFEKLLKVFEEVLLLEAKCVLNIRSINQKQFKYSIDIGTDRSNCSLTMHASKEFSLVTAHGEIHTTVDRLYTKMLYDNVSTFTIQPKQLLTLHKVPKTIIKSFESLKKNPLITCADYLSLSSPHNFAFSLEANHLHSNFYHPCGKRLTLHADDGMKIVSKERK